MRNDRYLKRLCDEQQDQIKSWKHYCYRQEMLLSRCLKLLELDDDHEPTRAEAFEVEDLIIEINKILNEDTIR